MKVFYILLAVVAYATIGMTWMFLRWTQFVKAEIAYYQSERQRFMNFHRVRGDDIPDFLKYEWRNYVNGNPRLQVLPPDPQDHQRRLGLNMGLWPLSMASLIAQKLYSVTVQRLMNEYTRSTSTRLSAVRKDLEK